MRTKFIYILSIILGAGLFTSCEGLLDDVDHQGATSVENFYQTDVDAEEAITSVYNQWRSVTFNSFFLKNLLSDDAFCGGGSKGDQSHYEQLNEYRFSTANTTIEEGFSNLYALIYHANLVINNFSDDSDAKVLAIAEAKVARAWAYFNLVTLWGPVPLVTTELSPSEFQQPNTEVSVIWAQIEADYKDAIDANILPEKSSSDDSSLGARLTKQAAQAFLGKALLFQGKSSEAAVMLKSVINSGLYELIGDYENVLRTVEDFSSENIFEINYVSDGNNTSQGLGALGNMYGWRSDKMELGGYDFGAHDLYPGGWGFMNPTEALYDAFVAEEGVEGYRLNATIKSYEKVMEIGAPNYPITVSPAASLYGHEGYFAWKIRFLGTELVPNSSGYTADNNYRIMRFSEVLLLAAEACLESSDEVNALAYINEVRLRAQLDELTSVTLDDIKVEKRLELCFEGVRYQDLIRWDDAETALAEQGKQVPIFSGLNGDGSYNVTYPYTNSHYGFVSGKNELLPFPQKEMLVNVNLTQNTGW